MVNTDYVQDDDNDNDNHINIDTDDIDDEAPHRTFGLGHGGGRQARLSIRREHR